MASDLDTQSRLDASGAARAALGGARTQAMQRLQIGLTGFAVVVLLVGVADVVMNRAQQTEAGMVPEAAATVAPEVAVPANDPLADAGVVPDLPAEPTPAASQSAPFLPEQPDASPPQVQ